MASKLSDMSPLLSATTTKTQLLQSKSTAQYRISEYHDGKSIRIQESRRRSAGTDEPRRSPTHRPRYYSESFEGSLSVRATPLLDSDDQYGLYHPTAQIENAWVYHVTPVGSRVSSPTVRPKAVVIQSPKPVKGSKRTNPTWVEKQAMPTPPPTPKLGGRLPTPDIPELNEAPFCGCCVSPHVVRYCASCGRDISDHRG
ncbi:hypothetical protein EJ04DRAFT_112712 [Polyplosphaeria fusca]|uniref:Uncharacterized protein n=1 Tax=Polyplosphaeria fusca TaxID=682080 RepID=A0A9P4RCF3_9PLEO|nr:hypothetical protein EJ04DRAFT_112712 [Polyplosphaeria fusca]